MRTVNQILMGTVMAAALFAMAAAVAAETTPVAAETPLPAPSVQPAQSRQAAQCGEREQMIAYLARTYDERPIAAGLRSDGRVLEVLASKTGETWSVLISTANGIACLAASGEAWLPMTSELALQSADPGA